MYRVFISYSRANGYIARRLRIDLQRAGAEPWFDQHDIQITDEWLAKIENAIREHEFFLFLWSPEADKSPYVRHEYEFAKKHLAADKIGIARVAGKSSEMPDDLRKMQHADLTEEYWAELPRLLLWLETGTTRLKSLDELRNNVGSIAEVREVLGDEDPKEWNIWTEAENSWRTFIRVPITPSGYAMSWLIAENNSGLQLQGEMQVVMKFTGDRSRDTVKQVLEYWLASHPATPPQILFLEGPQQDRVYDIPNDKPHIWNDCIVLARKTISDLCGNRLAHYFMDSPQSLVFPLGASFPVQRSFAVYNLNQNTTANGLYSCVYRK